MNRTEAVMVLLDLGAVRRTPTVADTCDALLALGVGSHELAELLDVDPDEIPSADNP